MGFYVFIIVPRFTSFGPVFSEDRMVWMGVRGILSSIDDMRRLIIFDTDPTSREFASFFIHQFEFHKRPLLKQTHLVPIEGGYDEMSKSTESNQQQRKTYVSRIQL